MGVLRCPRTVDHPLPSLPESCSHCWELPGFALVHRAARDPCHLLSAPPTFSHSSAVPHSLQWCLVGPQVVPPSELPLSPGAAPPQGQSSWASTPLPHPCRGSGPSPPSLRAWSPSLLGPLALWGRWVLRACRACPCPSRSRSQACTSEPL